MDEHGVGLIQTLGAILAVGCSNQICEQVYMCMCLYCTSITEKENYIVSLLFLLNFICLFIIVKALCVLVNLSSGCTRSRDRIAESDLVVQCLVQLLVRHFNLHNI